jgi:mono/diheme cytochrome c family protein
MMKLLIMTTAVIATLGFYSFIHINQSDEWVVPDSAKNVKNPTDATDEDDLEIEKELYMKHCKSCHGKEGLGDGPKAGELDTEMDDLSSEEVQSQTDGELFYKITKGRDDMPNFDKKLADEEDRWLVVNYIRTLEE